MLPSEYRFPAEYEEHRATWLLWPTRPDNWRCDAYFGQNDTLALAALISHFEPVRIGATSAAVETLQRSVPPNVEVVALQYDDVWVRDTGPIIVVANGKPPIAISWKFNSWGGLFSNAALDDRVAFQIAGYEQIQVIEAPLVLEGGAVISDGAGTVIVTEESIVNENRNPGVTRADVNELFRKFLNVTNVIWLPYGLCHDEAGGHIDNVCAFAPKRTVLLTTTRDRTHPSYQRLRTAREILDSARDAFQRPFLVVEVPLPDQTFISSTEAGGFSSPNGTIVRNAGSPLAASHINFYAARDAIFLPTFNSPSDRVAFEIIARAFPGRQVVPYSSREFLLGGGAIHCLTREIPA